MSVSVGSLIMIVSYRLHFINISCITHCSLLLQLAISIGFEQSSYTFTEPDTPTSFPNGPDGVFIVKANKRSEQTFPLVFQVSRSSPDSTTGLATLSEEINGTVQNNDYVLTAPGNTSVVVNFLPGQQRLPFSFTLFPDELPESTEAFQASFAPGDNAPPFEVSLAEAFILILDNDGKKYIRNTTCMGTVYVKLLIFCRCGHWLWEYELYSKWRCCWWQIGSMCSRYQPWKWSTSFCYYWSHDPVPTRNRLESYKWHNSYWCCYY